MEQRRRFVLVTAVLVDLRLSQGRPTGIGVYTRELAIALSRHLEVRGLTRPGDPLSLPFETTVIPEVGRWGFDLIESMLARRLQVPLISLSRIPVLFARAQAIPMVHDVVPLILPETVQPSRVFLERVSYPWLHRARMIITGSESSRLDLVRHLRLAAEKICVVYDGPPPVLQPRAGVERLRELGIGADFVLAVGTLEPRKNLPRLVDAFERHLSGLPLQLVVAGGLGWKYGPILRAMERLSAAGTLVRLGYVSDQDKALLYRRALCLAFPSLYEGFGLPILEAMSYGLPVIVSSAPACREVIGQAGLVLDPADSGAWAEAITGLWQNPARRAELTELGRERSRQFTWERSIEPLLRRLAAGMPAAAAA